MGRRAKPAKVKAKARRPLVRKAPEKDAARVHAVEKRLAESLDQVTQDLLEEAVRMRACPGVHFADEPAGREAKVTGTGLGVWEVVSMYRGAGSNVKRLRARHPHLSEAQIKAALTYDERHHDEIDALTSENEAFHETGLRRE